MSKTIFFSVGEPSGDQHAARLVQSLTRQYPGLKLRGFGGEKMREAGCEIDLDLTEHAVFGILEVLPKLRQFFRFADQAEAVFASDQVDAVVLVDFPGFNWHIAKRAKKYGIPVIYYCPPQLWAWGAWRVKKMKASVDHVLAVLPMEEQFFGRHGIPTSFVGHPFFDSVAESELDAASTEQLISAAPSEQTVAVLPGSRTHEVSGNWPIMLRAIRELSAAHPDVRFAVAAYREKHLEFCRASAQGSDSKLPIDFYLGATSEIIDHAACAMMVSGSVSLELMARQTPAAVMYRVGRFLYAVGKCVVKVDSMTLPNLMPTSSTDQRESEVVFPEIVSVGDPTAATDFLVHSIGRMLSDPAYLDQKRRQLSRLSDQFARPGATDRAAIRISELLSLESGTETGTKAA